MLIRAWSLLCRLLLALGLAGASSGSVAGLSVYTSWGALPPTSAANQRTVDFSTHTLASEGVGRLTHTTTIGDCNRYYLLFVGMVCHLGSDTGSVNLTATNAGLTGFSGNHAAIYSGLNDNATSLTVTFTNPTPYVGFLWGVQFNSENTQFIRLTLENNATVVLKNCRTTWDAQCVGAYVPGNWLADVYNLLLGWLFGDAIQYHAVYVQYQPDNGVRIKMVEFQTYECRNCGFLSADTTQTMRVDFLTYVDGAVAPHHLRLSTPSSTVFSNADVPVTVTACGNADCSLPYINGVSGTLSLAGVTGSYAPSGTYAIPAGPGNTAGVTLRFTATGTATLGIATHTPTPTNTPRVFCGMGVTPASGNSCNLNVGAALHHVRVASSATGLTCTPNTYTITACSNADCSSLYTGGLSGSLSISGGSVNYPSGTAFSIGAGSSSTNVQAQLTQPQAYTVALTSLSPAPSSAPSVYCGMGATPSSGGSCVQTMAEAGFLFDVPHHVAGDSQSVSISAVRKADNSLACAPAFTGSKAVNFRCSYSNPTTGLVPVRVAGSALNAGNNPAAACDGAGRSVALTFNASGVATAAIDYADAGLVGVTASYTGSGADAGLSMTGSDTFVAAPAAFAFSSVTAGPIKAGRSFSATVTAVNRAGAATANFGRETTPASATLSFARRQPTGAGAQSGSFSGSLAAFVNGAVTASNLNWSEAGNGDLSASSANYLGSGLSVSGNTGAGPAGAVGPFVPDHFVVLVGSQACGSFTYSGQPFSMTVRAQNASNGLVANFDGSAGTTPNFARAVALSAATQAGLGELATTSLPASAFVAGEATLSTQRFTFNDKLTAPAAVGLRAAYTEAGVLVSSSGQTEQGPVVRSGRLRLSNAFGTEKDTLAVPMQAHYWTGKAWALNAADSCTVIDPAHVARGPYRDHRGALTTAWTTSVTAPVTLNQGKRELILTAPTGGATGTVDLAVNLGAGTTDQSCASTPRPNSMGAQRQWLRALNGSCASTHDRDPSARATFGVYRPETGRAVHAQEVW